MREDNQYLPDILFEIIKDKQEQVRSLKSRLPLLKARCRDIPKALSFTNALKPAHKASTVIAEVKKASPSAGVISNNFNPVFTALQYEKAGADVISVLTDINFFKGDPDYLRRIKNNVKVPVLRKDFIISEEQIYETKCLGGDSFLLIASVLETGQLKEYIQLGRDLGMEPLVEVHNESELIKALEAKPKIIGINNRNLKNFTVDINKTVKLIPKIPEDKIIVGESGITSVKIGRGLLAAGCNSLLIGEYLMRSDNKAELIKKIKGSK
ncbi:MAG: indole-3-glycerol phosphate synthase TrpC [Victivallales bacterium]|nr:indole-3-glycerol phosphate synthase TrpC [Victivallales bacterium]